MKPDQIRVKGYNLIDDNNIEVNFITWDGECLCSKQQHCKTFQTDTRPFYKVFGDGYKSVDVKMLKHYIAQQMTA